MSVATENKHAYRLQVGLIRDEAEQEASTARRWATVWKWLGRTVDVMAIGLAGVAAATSGIALDPFFVAVPAGLAAVGASVGVTVRPGQLAARDDVARDQWRQLTSDVDSVIGGWDGLSVADAKAAWDDLRHRRDAIRSDATRKRSEFAPATW